MNEKTLKITQGALISAVFGVLIFLNRQTAGVAEGVLMYIYPIPMAVYAARYGLLTSLPVVAAMTLIGFMLGTPTAAIYALCEVVVGRPLGSCLYKKMDPTKTLVIVMALSIASSMLNLVILAEISGVNLSSEAEMLKESFLGAAEKFGLTGAENQSGFQMPAELLSIDYLKKMLVISVATSGALQGFIVYEISLLIMRKLRIKVQKPKSIYELHPPKWTGYAAFALWIIYTYGAKALPQNEILQTVLMALGLFSYIYLLFFGFIAANIFLRAFIKGHNFLCAVISFFMCFLLVIFVVLLGFLYITGLAEMLSDIYRKPGAGSRQQ